MTDQQRLDGFLLAYESIVKMYGVQLAAQIQTRQFGAMVQCEPVLTPAFVAEWQAPTTKTVGINEVELVPSGTIHDPLPAPPIGEAKFMQVSDSEGVHFSPDEIEGLQEVMKLVQSGSDNGHE